MVARCSAVLGHNRAMTAGTTAPASRRFPFRLPARWRLPLLIYGVTPRRAYVEVDPTSFTARFGWWIVRTPLTTARSYEITGPYRWWKAIGLRVTLGEWGLTFGTATDAGVCVRFDPPVRLFGSGHPNVTVTVADVAGLAAALRERGIPGTDLRYSRP